MRILTRNILEENSSIVMTNADTNYPVENIYSNMLKEVAQASSSSTKITVTLLNDKIVDSFFIAYHNASSIVITFKDVTNAVIATYTLSYPDVSIKQYITRMTDVRYVEIEMVSSDGLVFVGNISCGEYTQLYNVGKPIRILYKDSSEYTITDGGQILYKKGTKLISMNLTLNKNTEEQADSFEDAYDYVGKGKAFWLDRHEDAATLPIYGIFSDDHTTDEIDKLTNISFSFLEAK